MTTTPAALLAPRGIVVVTGTGTGTGTGGGGGRITSKGVVIGTWPRDPGLAGLGPRLDGGSGGGAKHADVRLSDLEDRLGIAQGIA
jgi:hypothetical protein